MSTITLGGIDLPDGYEDGWIEWIDRQSWQPVAQAVRQTLGGSPVIYAAAQTLRPITLVADGQTAVIHKDTLAQLQTLAAVPGAAYTLDYQGDIHAVLFRHHETPAIEAEPVAPFHDYYAVTLKLMAI